MLWSVDIVVNDQEYHPPTIKYLKCEQCEIMPLGDAILQENDANWFREFWAI